MSNESYYILSKDKEDQNTKHKISKTQQFFLHLKLLTWKNYLVHNRNKKITFCQMISPVVLCFILFGFQLIVNSFSNETILNPPVSIATPLQTCIPGNSGTCVSLGYTIVVINFI